jgi:hypothetical protein
MKVVKRWLGAFLIFAGSASAAQEARPLLFEVELLELKSPLSAQTLEAQLASPDVLMVAHYQSSEKIPEVTGRYEPKLPWGRYWQPHEKTTYLSAPDLKRSGSIFHGSLPASHPAHPSYRLAYAELLIPMPADNPDVPKPLYIRLMDELPESGIIDTTVTKQDMAVSFTARVRTRKGSE